MTTHPATFDSNDDNDDSDDDDDDDAGVSDIVSLSCSGYYSDLTTSEKPKLNGVSLTIPESNGDLEYENDDDDEDEDNVSDWDEDEWPADHPLPLPEWGCDRPELSFPSKREYEEFLERVTIPLRQCLDSLPYDTFTNFLAFSLKYLSSKDDYSNLKEFFKDYNTPLIPGSFSCVGLSLDLSSRLSQLESYYPGIKDTMYQVSCEEIVPSLEKYYTELPPQRTSLIEHVLLCIKIRVSGRAGVTLFDPGYHVSQPITVMEDGMTPHSSCINGSSARLDIRRTYSYNYLPSNPAIIGWTICEEREGKPAKEFYNRIHVRKPFLSGIDLAERRNLVYRFKSMLGRNSEGQLKCGFYFPIRECAESSVTLFYPKEEKPFHKKVPVADFLLDHDEEEVEEAIIAVANGLRRNPKALRSSFKTLANILTNSEFVQEMLLLDKEIDHIPL